MIVAGTIMILGMSWSIFFPIYISTHNVLIYLLHTLFKLFYLLWESMILLWIRVLYMSWSARMNYWTSQMQR